MSFGREGVCLKEHEMAYSELIKDFERIRDYIREFYVYGFRSRDEFTFIKSARSYDNERRRVESWLEDYISFRQNAQGKNVFISVDSRAIPHNPLYRAFKTKSFTANDIILHFFLMDFLRDQGQAGIREILDGLCTEYPETFERSGLPDESTVRSKLNELTDLGIIEREKKDGRIVYRIAPGPTDLSAWQDALDFFSETAPLGVTGSFLLDKLPEHKEHFYFKHHYLMQVIDSEILLDLLLAIDERRKVRLTVKNLLEEEEGEYLYYINTPVNIYISTENGRQYCLGWNAAAGRFFFTRLDRIVKVELLKEDPAFEQLARKARGEAKHLWGVSFGGLEETGGLEHMELEIRVEKYEYFIVQRLMREKRCGQVKKIAPDRYLFTADVYDAREMLPWIYSLTGRIERISCSNPAVIEKFYADLKKTAEYYE